MYSTNRNIQIKLNHKLFKIKSRYIKLQYNVWQDFSLARFQLHVFLRLVKPTLKADLWEQSMSDVALKSIRFGYNVKKTTWVYMKDPINTNQMLFFTELKNLFLLRYFRQKFQKYKGFYGKFQLQMLISRNHENLCLRLMEHAGKVIFGQVGDLLVYFRRKVPDFRFFDFWGIYDMKWGKFWKNYQNLPKFARFWNINAPKISKSKIGDFTSEIHQKISNLAKNHLSSMFH